MNATRTSEIRTYRDMQAQADLERMLKARRDAELAREARFRKLPTPSQCDTPKPEPFAWVDAGVFLTPMAIVAALILLARWSGVLS